MKYIFKFPDIGEGLEEGKIIQWYVEKGQKIESGDPLVNMETDKVVTDIPSPKDGVISQIFGAVGETIKVGSALVEIDIEGVEAEAAVEEAATGFKPATKEQVEEKGFGVVGTIEVASDGAYLPSSDEAMHHDTTSKELRAKKVLATPVARAMAKDLNVDINSITGTGPAGRVTKKDVEKALHQAQVQSPAPMAHPQAEAFRTEPMSMMRKTIAKNMHRSKQNAVHMSVMDEVDVSELVAIRKQLKPHFEAKKLRLSYLPFIIKAVAVALQEFPILNAELDMEHEQIIYKNQINLGIAVDTPEGLVVPVIANADKKNLFELAAILNDFAVRAPERKLQLEELRGGTFSITSYGSIGGYYAVPVINYPQVAILGIGTIKEKPIVKDGAIVVGNLLPISMSVDHRIVDGGEVARFLNRVLQLLGDPILLLAMADKGAEQ